jgi:hypothetical protein
VNVGVSMGSVPLGSGATNNIHSRAPAIHAMDPVPLSQLHTLDSYLYLHTCLLYSTYLHTSLLPLSRPLSLQGISPREPHHLHAVPSHTGTVLFWLHPFSCSLHINLPCVISLRRSQLANTPIPTYFQVDTDPVILPSWSYLNSSRATGLAAWRALEMTGQI